MADGPFKKNLFFFVVESSLIMKIGLCLLIIHYHTQKERERERERNVVGSIGK